MKKSELTFIVLLLFAVSLTSCIDKVPPGYEEVVNYQRGSFSPQDTITVITYTKGRTGINKLSRIKAGDIRTFNSFKYVHDSKIISYKLILK